MVEWFKAVLGFEQKSVFAVCSRTNLKKKKNLPTLKLG